MLTNVALASFGTRVMADSFAPWYRTWPVNDGKRNELDEVGRWGKVRWLSAGTLQPHWLQVLFPGVQELTRVEVYWAREAGRFLMPREYSLERWSGEGWQPVRELERIEAADGCSTAWTLEPLMTDRLRLYMPAGGGPAGDQAAVLGVAEFEAYSPNPRLGVPSTLVVLPAHLESRANPCWLNWQGVPDATGYSLEYSMSPAFPPDETTHETLRTNYHTPTAPLALGRWYWRVLPVLPEGNGVWSEPGVIDMVQGFTWQPSPAGPWKATHPRLPWAAVDRSALLAQAEGPKAEIWRQIQAAVRQAVPHVAQIRNMQDSGPARDGLPAEPPGFENDFWTIERWREIVAAGATVLESLTLGSLFLALTDEPEVREQARRLLLHAAAWGPAGSTGIDSVDHAAHDVLVGLSAGYDALYHHLTQAERDQVRTAIVARCQLLWRYLNPFTNDPNNNHPWFHTTALAVGAMAVWDEVPEATEWVEFAIQLYVGRFLCLGGLDGEWHEGSDYWTYSLGFVFDFCDAIRSVTGIQLAQHPWLQGTALYKQYVAPPGGPGLSFGDTHLRPPNGEDAVKMFWLASVNRDSHAQWYGLQALAGAELKRPGLLMWLMLWWDPTIPALPPTDLPLAKLFREAGFAKLHTTLEHQRGTHFALHSGRFHGVGGGHSHADQNHFMLYAGGESLVVDSGCYDYYGSPHFNNWYIRTCAHNTILVDGQEQACQRAGADGQIISFLHSDGCDYLVGDASNPVIYSGKLTRFLRHVLFLRPSSPDQMGRFVLFDDLAAQAPATYDWLLHTHAEPIITQGGKTARATIARSQANLALTLIASTPLAANVTTGFPDGLAPTREVPAEWHTTFKTQTAASTQTFLAVLDPHQPGRTPAEVHAESERAVRIYQGNSEQLVIFGGSDSAIQTDAAACAITRDNGNTMHWLAADATGLTADGVTLLEASAPVTLSWWRTPDGQEHWVCQSDRTQTIRLYDRTFEVHEGETRQ